MIDDKNSDQAATNAMRQLGQFENALASNAFSGNVISSDAGKTALSALLASAGSDEFDVAEARATIKRTMGLR